MAEALNITILFETNCNRYDLKANVLHCKTKSQAEPFTIANHLVIAADGYSSTIREALQKELRFNYS